jgi:hypothetical protein
MEKCSVCNKEINAQPHTICAKCGSTVCVPCGAEKSAECPICGFNGKN